MLAGDFMFVNKFKGLTDEMISEAALEIESRFGGVVTMWKVLPPKQREAKQRLCFNYLIAWYLMNMHPECAPGLSGTGGMPLTNKSIGDVHVGYNMPLRKNSVLQNLTTNTFGLQALEMIQTAPESYMWVT